MVPFRTESVVETKATHDEVKISLGDAVIFSRPLSDTENPKQTAAIIEGMFAAFLGQQFREWLDE